MKIPGKTPPKSTNLTNVLLTVSYDGTNFCGYQVQPNKRTVQSELEKAINLVTGEAVKTVASGRTDSGVHAYGQAVNFKTNSTIPPEKFATALNTVLPNDVKVLKSIQVNEDFNARYSAKRKTYEYSCYLSNVIEPLKDRYSTRITSEVDINLIKNACSVLLGEHDFKCFLSSGSSVKTTVRTIYEASVNQNGNNLTFSFTGNGFLYNMVRILVGTLLDIGAGKKDVSSLILALQTGERKLVGKTMDARGLCLVSVNY